MPAPTVLAVISEMAIEQFGDEMVTKAKQLAQQQANKPNPEQIKAQIMQQKGQTDLMVGKVRAQADMAKAQSSDSRNSNAGSGQSAGATGRNPAHGH